jgi:hypothetical protein
MAVNKPVGDNARGRGEEAHAAEEPTHQDLDQAQQSRRAVHGGQKERQKVQGRASGEVMGKAALIAIVIGVASLIGLAVFVIQL